MLPIGVAVEQKRFPRATVAFVTANFVVFLCEIVFFPFLIDEQVRVLTYGTGSLNPFALFTSIFLHASCGHVFFNNVFLWVFGPPVEDRVGPKLFAVYYLGAGVAANVLQAVVDAVHAPERLTYGIGASGAISGIMAIYLYRCWHTKVKMFIPVMFLPVTVRVPAVPLMVFFFVKDVVGGFSSFSSGTNVAHWAHVGGFLFGLAVGRVKRYGHEAAVENCETALMDKLRSGGGWDGLKDESTLVRLLDLSPEDPERHLQLAQYYTAKGEKAKARDSYRHAVQKHFVRNPYYGACALLEMMDAGIGTLQPHHHLRAAEELSGAGSAEEAYRVIRPAIGDGATGVLAERAYLLYLKLCRELYKDEEVASGIETFAKRFPQSVRNKEAAAVVKLAPGGIFPKKKEIAAPESARKTFEEPEHVTKHEMRLATCFNEFFAIFTDVRFFSLFLLLLPLWFLFPGYVIFPLVFITTGLLRIDWGGLLWRSQANEEQQRREAEAATLLNRAALADRSDNHAKAAELYEKYLAVDQANIQARYSLARIYENRLGDLGNALRHYRKLVEHAPAGHPYHAEAREMLSRPKRRE